MLSVFYDSYCILNKVYSEGAYLKQAISSVPVDPYNRSAVTKICYGTLDRDLVISYWISRLCDKSPKLAVRTVLKISMYCIKFLEKAPYAVTDTAVELLNKLGKKGVSGFVNAILRKFIVSEIALPDEKLKNLSLTYDFPEFAVQKLIDQFGEDGAVSIMGAPAEKTCLRFRGVSGEEYLAKRRIAFEKTPYDNVFFADKFTRNEDYDKGLYTFQSIGSVAICDAVSGGETLLDACAAPGGKSVLLSAKFKKVVSTELHEHRAELIREYAERMRAENIEVKVCDASVFNPDFEEKFDAVLCDVPCSGFGVIKSNPDMKIKKTAETVSELKKIQKSILSVCSRYVKRGGALYYSTCTYFKEECDEVVKEFLKDNDGFTTRIISIKIPYKKTNFGYQMLPDISFGAGFYISALGRKE